MNNSLVKMNGMDILETSFAGDNLFVVQMHDDGKTYVGVMPVCVSLGLSDGQIKNERKRLQTDLVLSRGGRNLVLPTKGGNQKSLCLELDYLPLWLAKISITPDMRENKPELTSKLIEYQLKAKDALAREFISSKESWDASRVISVYERKKLTDMINVELNNPAYYVYTNFTNMIYKVLFGMTAKQIREARNITSDNEHTRDYLTSNELALLTEAENIVAALIALGFKYDYIKEQINRRYAKQLSA